MNPSEIITNEVRKEGDDPAKVMAAIKAQVSTGNSMLLHENDSVFFLTRLGENAVQVFLFTADGMSTLPSIVTAVLKKIKASGAVIIYGDSKNVMFLNALHAIGAPVRQEQDTDQVWSLSL